MKMPTPKSEPPTPTHGTEHSMDFSEASTPKRNATPSPKQLTPYQLYMRENYVSLKKQCKDDKKAIFAKCHERWENESEDVKALYERKAEEDYAAKEHETSMRLADDLDTSSSSIRGSRSNELGSDEEVERTNMYMTNRALNLESAVMFASLVALHHIDMNTRDLQHLDIVRLLDRSMIFPHGLEEI